MSLDSYLELFTSLYGWAFYGILWDVMVATGIVYLPFLGILIDNWREPAEGGEFGTVTSLSLRRMEIELFIALLVVVLAAQPASLTPLTASTLSYQPQPTLVDQNPPQATVADSQSTYGTTGFTGSPSTVNVPVWWYAVMSISAGLNHAIAEGLPVSGDLRTFEQQARLATIASPLLRQETGHFFSQCFVPARSRFQAERPNSAIVAAILSEYGMTDIEWIGSHVYRDVHGYFDSLRPTGPIAGFTYQPARDTEYDIAAPPQWGRPTCKEWWEDGNAGLRRKLIDEANATSGGLSGLVVALAPTLATEKQNDTVVRTVLNNAPAYWSDNGLVAGNTASNGWMASAERMLKGAFASGGVAIASAVFAMTMAAILQALPMIQALMLLGIYALLPLVIVLSRYSISVMVIGAMAIFTVKFWTVLWFVARWVDQNLIHSMYPNVTVFFQIFANPGEHDAKRMLLNMITTSMYLGLPLLWSGMMAWGGVRIGRAINGATQPLTRPVEQSSQEAGRLGKTALKSLAKK